MKRISLFVVPVIASLSSVALVSRTHGAYFPTLILSIIKTSDFIIQHTADERMSSFDIEFFVNIGHVLFYVDVLINNVLQISLMFMPSIRHLRTSNSRSVKSYWVFMEPIRCLMILM